MKVTICKKAHFNAAYPTRNPHWPIEQNEEVFGQGSWEAPGFVAHNYELECCLTGTPNPLTGQVYDSDALGRLLKAQVERRFDHKNLYADMDDFKNTVPTVEMLCVRIWHLLRAQLPETLALRLVLHDHKTSYATYAGE